MIGRNAELECILGQVDAMCAKTHARNVTFITGEAGMGKTTLLRAIEQRLASRRGPDAPLVVTTECSTPLLGQDVGQVEALEPWSELLEHILSHDGEPGKKTEMAKLVGSVALAWIHVIPVVGGVLESSIETAALMKEHYGHDGKKGHATSQEQMFQQYINFLAKASEAHPLVLVLDDFHWADTSSTNLLFSAARHLATKRVLFLIAYRADDAASSRGGQGHPLLHVRNELGRYSLYTDVVVPKMTPTDLDGLLRARYSRYDKSAEFERWLAERSGGNALFITQYLATLEEDGIVSPQTGEFKARFDSVRVPTSAFSVVEERIRRLDDDARELLRYASVEGATFTVTVVSAIAEVPRLRLLQKLRLIAEKHGVIKSLGKQRIYAGESTTYQFTNVLMQRALYESLEDEEKDELHARVFQTIKADWAAASDGESSLVGLAARLVAHAATPDDRYFAAKLLLDAARVSWGRFADEETLSVLLTLMKNVETLDATRVLHGKPAEREVRELESGAHMLMGRVHKFRGRYPQALEHFRAARALFEKDSTPDGEGRALEAMMRESFALENARLYSEAEALTRATLARAEKLGDARVESGMLNNLGLVLTAMGRQEEGLEHQRKSLALRVKTGDLVGQAVSLGSMGLALFSMGRLDEALEHHRTSLTLRETLGDRVGQGYSLTNLGNTVAASGRLDEALEFHRRSVEVREASGDVVGLVASLENEARLLGDLGRSKDAIERLERAVRLRETLGNRGAEAALLVRLATLLRAADEPARSRTLFVRARALAVELGAEPMLLEIDLELATLPPAPEAEAERAHASNGATTATSRVEDPAGARDVDAGSLPPLVRAALWLHDRFEKRFPT